MKHLYDEVLRRFPEVESYTFEGDEDLPYLFVGYIADWLQTVAKPELDPDIIRRVVEFDMWCLRQPSGESAADDVFTIWLTALRERLFEHDELLPLIPKVMPLDELVQNRDYLVAWVGLERYEAALRLAQSAA